MTTKAVAFILSKTVDDEQQKQNINIYIKSAPQWELVGMFNLLYTYLPKDLEIILQMVKKEGVESIIIDAGKIPENLIGELHSYVLDYSLELVVINRTPIQLKRFIIVLPEVYNEDCLQLEDAKIINSKLDSEKEIMKVISIATKYCAKEIIVLSNHDLCWMQDTYLYKLKRIAEVMNIELLFTSSLNEFANE